MIETPAYVFNRKILFNPYHYSLENNGKHIINTSLENTSFRGTILNGYTQYIEQEQLEITYLEDAFFQYVRSAYNSFGAEPGTENHIIGTMYLGNFLFEKYRDVGGIFGIETAIRRESGFQNPYIKKGNYRVTPKIVRPDVFFITSYDKVVIIEVQNNGKLCPCKAKTLNAFTSEVDNLPRIYISFKEPDSKKDIDRLTNDLLASLDKNDIDTSLVTLCTFPANIDPFLDSSIRDFGVARMVKEKKLN